MWGFIALVVLVATAIKVITGLSYILCLIVSTVLLVVLAFLYGNQFSKKEKKKAEMKIVFSKKRFIIIVVSIALLVALGFCIDSALLKANKENLKEIYEYELEEVLGTYGLQLDYVDYNGFDLYYEDTLKVIVHINGDISEIESELIHDLIDEIKFCSWDTNMTKRFKYVSNEEADSEDIGLSLDYIYINSDRYENFCHDGNCHLYKGEDLIWVNDKNRGSNEELEFEDLSGTGFNNTRPGSPAESNEIKAYLMKCVECGNHTDNGVNSRCDSCRERAKDAELDDWT